jgi:oligopeptide transport system ATP-binding protein
VSKPASPLLSLEDVSKTFTGTSGIRRTAWTTRAVRDVSFDLRHGESLALVGESGSGKTTIARMIVGLERPTGGRIAIDGVREEDSDRMTRRSRAGAVQMVFQDPYTSLTPHLSVIAALDEVQRVHFSRAPAERRRRTLELLESVGLGEREGVALPKELSGGQRQRAAIARALAVEPRVLVLDEPVSALDVSIQAQILNLLADLRSDLGLTYLFITHDLAVVQQVADSVVVLYRGRVVESGPVAATLGGPLHPYTRRLLESVPRPHQVPERRLGVVTEDEIGCVFRARCALVQAACAVEPALDEIEPGRWCRCWFAGAGAGGAGA